VRLTSFHQLMVYTSTETKIKHLILILCYCFCLGLACSWWGSRAG
jgi:hypothetical protein